VQQQALRDFAQAMSNFFAGTHRRPTWRKAGVHEGFRIVGRRGSHWQVRRLSRKTGEVWVPKVGWVRFRWSRQSPDEVKSFRVKAAIGRLRAREVDRRRDWVEQTSTDLARRFDVIRVEDLKIQNMVRSARGTVDAPGVNVRAKAGLNRSIHAAGWGRLVARLEDKAPGRVEHIDPAYTSQTCRACGNADHGDVNAAKNIAAGRAVTCVSRPTDPGRPPVRGALQPPGGAVNREPQPVATSMLGSGWNPRLQAGEDVKADNSKDPAAWTRAFQARSARS
jgi:IS605 OrfB family transposase